MDVKLIGITGHAGSGKDTLASWLAYKHGFDAYALATPIKRALNAMFGWSMYFWDDRDWKERVDPLLGVSPRVLAQTMGTEWGRELIHPDIWLRALEGDIHEYASRRVVISDVRFPNEARWIHDNGGLIIKLVRPFNQNGVTKHTSESGIYPEIADVEIWNNASIADLTNDAQEILLYQGIIKEAA